MRRLFFPLPLKKGLLLFIEWLPFMFAEEHLIKMRFRDRASLLWVFEDCSYESHRLFMLRDEERLRKSSET